MIRPHLCLAFAPLLLSCAARGQGDPKTVDAIINEGKNHSKVMTILGQITHDIGPRVTASPELTKGQEWAMAKFKEWGLSNVHLEKYGEASVGFQRGKRRVARMVTPERKELEYTTNNWVEGTNGLVRGAAVMAPGTVAEIKSSKNLKGAWVLCKAAVGMRGPRLDESPEYKRALDAVGIAGRIYGSPKNLLWSHGTWKDKTFESHPKDVSVTLTRAEFDEVKQDVESGKRTVLEFDLEHIWIKGPMPLYNVVAELPGTESPDECVIVGGHFDSWNAPGSQGAQDNGTGSAVTLEAARILTSVHARPKRTIRFILWSGEEEGLLGSKAYVQAHKSEWDKISCTLNDDGGTTYQGGYVGFAGMKSMMEQAFAPTVKAFPDMPQRFEVTANMRGSEDSDHAPFNNVGIPGLDTIESGVGDYEHVWHTQFDRYETCNSKYLIQSATNHAVVSFNLACAATLLPRK